MAEKTSTKEMPQHRDPVSAVSGVHLHGVKFGLKSLGTLFIAYEQSVLFTTADGPGEKARASRLLRAIQHSSRALLPEAQRLQIQLDQTKDSIERTEGLLPTIDLKDLAQLLPNNFRIAELLQLETSIETLLLEQALFRCPRPGCGLMQGQPEKVLRELSEGSGLLLVSAPMRMGLVQREERLKLLLFSLVSRGFKRFLVGENAFRLGEEKAPLIELCAQIAAADFRWSVVVDSVDTGEPGWKDRLQEGLQTAFSLGSESLDLLRLQGGENPFRSGHLSPGYERLMLARFGWCENCGRIAPKMSSAVLKSAWSNASGQTTDLDALIPWIGDVSVLDLFLRSFDELPKFFEQFTFSSSAMKAQVELESKSARLQDLGLASLSPKQKLRSVSSGERLRLAAAYLELSAPAHTLILLDQLSRILHPQDLGLLWSWSRRMQRLGNTIVLADDQPGLRARADVVCEVTSSFRTLSPEERLVSSTQFLTSPLSTPIKGRAVEVPLSFGGTELRLPLHSCSLIALVGRSGVGKTQLLEALEEALASQKNLVKTPWRALRSLADEARELPFRSRETVETLIDRVSLLRPLADLFAALPAARRGGWIAEDFLLNEGRGRCESCKGSGKSKVGRGADVGLFESCAQCGGERYQRAILEVQWKGQSIADVLQLAVSVAVPIFPNQRELLEGLKELEFMGLGEAQLGALMSSLSFSEVQRVQLSRMFRMRREAKTLFLLDQAFAGLSNAELEKCLHRVRMFLDAGSSIVFTTHDPAAIRLADAVIELESKKNFKVFSTSRDFSLDHFADLGQV